MGMMKGRSPLRGTAESVAAAIPARPLPAHAAAETAISRMMPRQATGDTYNKIAAILARYPTIQS
jgi:hypothetical protein